MRLLAASVCALAVASCAIFGAAERKDLVDHGATLNGCEEMARKAAASCDAGKAACDHAAIDAYKSCKKEAGL